LPNGIDIFKYHRAAKKNKKGWYCFMIVDTNFAVVLLCAGCGVAHTEKISAFRLNAVRALNIDCACGNRLGVLTLRGQGSYELNINCPLCRHSHLARFTLISIFDRKLFRPVENCRLHRWSFIGSLAKARKELCMRNKIRKAGKANAGSATSFSIYCENCGPKYVFSEDIELKILDRRALLFCKRCGKVLYTKWYT
jgi:hypothetical protein